MAQDAELRIDSAPVEKLTTALTNAVGWMEKFAQSADKVEQSNKGQTQSHNKTEAALKASEIAKRKAIALMDLEAKKLDKAGQEYAKLKGEILAQEQAARKGIDTMSKEGKELQKNIVEREQAAAAARMLAKETRAAASASAPLVTAVSAEEKALRASNAAKEKAHQLRDLELKGLDKNEKEYAELRGAILAQEQATLKSINTNSKEYKQILENTKARERYAASIRKTKAATKDANSGQVKLTKGMESLKGSLDRAAETAVLIDGPLGGIASRFTAISGIISRGAIGMVAMSTGLALVSRNLLIGAQTADQAEVSLKAFDAQLQATGNVAGVTAEELDTLARNLAMNTLGNTQEFREATAAMLSYKGVSRDSFETAIGLAKDMSLVMKTSVTESTKAIGKALQDPIQGLTSLKERAVVFSEEQEKQIRQAVAQGEAEKARLIILEELQHRFEGVANAQADTLSGDLDTYGQLWEELWEGMGKHMIPSLREIVQGTNELLRIATDLTTLEWEKDMQAFAEANKDNMGSVAEIESLIAQEQDKYQKALGERIKMQREGLSLWPNERAEQARQIEALEDEEFLQKRILDLLYARRDARADAEGAGDERDTREFDKMIEEGQRAAAQQRELLEVFQETGDTRADAFLKAKAAQDAENAALSANLFLSKEQKEALTAVFEERAKLTRAMVEANAIVQQEKSLQSQQTTLQSRIELYKLEAAGVSKTSEEYLGLQAVLRAKQQADKAGYALDSEAYQILLKNNMAIAEQTRELAKLKAVRATGENTVQFRAMERELELYELIKSGVDKNSEAYIRERNMIDLRNRAKLAGIEVGSEEYDQMMKNVEAMTEMEVKLKRIADLEALGLSRDSLGNLIVGGTMEAIEESFRQRDASLLGLLEAGEISQDTYDKLREQLDAFTLDEANKLLLPLGIQQDEDGQQFLADSVQAVVTEKNEMLKELETAFREGTITDEEAYLQRRAELSEEYEGKIADAKVAQWRKTEAAKKLILAQETAGSIAAGLENLAAVKKNNSALAKAAKAFSLFQASASLVGSLAEASKLPWPTNIPAYAQAFAQGTQLIQMASSLNEPSFQFGGVDIQGPGTGRSDDIKANIARGESVVTASATSRYKETLRRMNAGLPIGQQGGGVSIGAPQINIQGDASENTVALIDESLRNFEDRVAQIAQGVSIGTIQEEQQVGGLFDPLE